MFTYHCPTTNIHTYRYRYKGVMSVKGMHEKFVFQGVGMLFSGGFTGARWKRHESRESRFVFIGKHLDKDALIDGFIDCKAGDLRFKVGDRVEANVGTFTPGRVVQLWDEGNAYRVELDDKERTNVFAPIDEDVYIREPHARGARV